MPRGRKKNYKGGHKHFTDPNEIKAREEKERKEKEWRRQRGIESESDEEDKEKDKGASASGGSYWSTGATRDGVTADGAPAPGDLPPSGSESESESDEEVKPKGLSHLIQTENPNHIQQKSKKVSELDTGDGKPQLTRKEREEIQKQQAKANYMKAHLAGKTEEAQSDLARLALIRKQREEAAAKKAAEKAVLDEKKKDAEKRLLDKKAANKK